MTLEINLSKDCFYYIASPYEGYIHGRAVAAAMVKFLSSSLLIRGYRVISPIVMGDQLAHLVTRGFDWISYDLDLLSRCDGLIVAEFDGWRDSKGVQTEIKYAWDLGRPIVHITSEEYLAFVKEDYGGIISAADLFVREENFELPSIPERI